ncbi:MAG: hypothetical protein ABFS17_07040 [Chloroflexota bacterium]
MNKRKFGSVSELVQQVTDQRAVVFSLLMIGALLAFEIFNYSTTEFAMADLLGGLSFGGLRWSTILALAFCGIDFAGIARLFTPAQEAEDQTEVWYLLAAWMLAATMNATLTWWGVSIAISQHTSLGSAVIPRETLQTAVPVFVAVMVWLSRVLIIGTFSVAGDKLFSQQGQRVSRRPRISTALRPQSQPRPAASFRRGSNNPRRTPAANRPAYSSFKPAPKPYQQEEGYAPSSMAAKSQGSNQAGTYS